MVTSYLKHRDQFVKVSNIKKNGSVTFYSLSHQKCDVRGPWGSVLRPILFFMETILCLSKLLKYMLFADDTTLFYSGESIKDVLQIVELEFHKIMNLFNANRLSLNISKTTFIYFI